MVPIRPISVSRTDLKRFPIPRSRCFISRAARSVKSDAYTPRSERWLARTSRSLSVGFHDRPLVPRPVSDWTPWTKPWCWKTRLLSPAAYSTSPSCGMSRGRSGLVDSTDCYLESLCAWYALSTRCTAVRIWKESSETHHFHAIHATNTLIHTSRLDQISKTDREGPETNSWSQLPW